MKNKRLFIILSSGVLLIVLAFVAQYKIIEVSARTVIVPVTIEQDGLDFGTVFPGEELEGTFTIQYVKDEGDPDSVTYKIILQEKPLPDGSGYYKDLCPHLTAVSVEEVGVEGTVGIDDPEDVWTIYFKVPAILGNVSQDNQGGVVDSSGEYGCDVSIDILSELP